MQLLLLFVFAFIGIFQVVLTARNGGNGGKAPRADCTSDGQFLLHPTNRCKYIHCTHSVVHSRGERNSFKEIIQDCPLGTSVPISLYQSKAWSDGVSPDRSLCTQEAMFKTNYCLVGNDEEDTLDDNDYFLLPVEAYTRREKGKTLARNMPAKTEHAKPDEQYSFSQNTPHEWYNILVEKNLQKSVIDGSSPLDGRIINSEADVRDDVGKMAGNWYKDPREKYKIFDTDYHEMGLSGELFMKEKPESFPDPPSTFHGQPFDLDQLKYELLDERLYAPIMKKTTVPGVKPKVKVQPIQPSSNNNIRRPSWVNSDEVQTQPPAKPQSYPGYNHGNQRIYPHGYSRGTRNSVVEAQIKPPVQRRMPLKPNDSPSAKSSVPQAPIQTSGERNTYSSSRYQNHQAPSKSIYTYKQPARIQTKTHSGPYGQMQYRRMPNDKDSQYSQMATVSSAERDSIITKGGDYSSYQAHSLPTKDLNPYTSTAEGSERAFPREYSQSGKYARNGNSESYNSFVQRPKATEIRSSNNGEYWKIGDRNPEYVNQKDTFEQQRPSNSKAGSQYESNFEDFKQGPLRNSYGSNGNPVRTRARQGHYEGNSYKGRKRQYSNVDIAKQKGDFRSRTPPNSDGVDYYPNHHDNVRQEHSDKSDSVYSNGFTNKDTEAQEQQGQPSYQGPPVKYQNGNDMYTKSSFREDNTQTKYGTNYEEFSQVPYESSSTINSDGFVSTNKDSNGPDIRAPYQRPTNVYSGGDDVHKKDSYDPDSQPKSMGEYNYEDGYGPDENDGQFGNSNFFTPNGYVDKNQDSQSQYFGPSHAETHSQSVDNHQNLDFDPVKSSSTMTDNSQKNDQGTLRPSQFGNVNSFPSDGFSNGGHRNKYSNTDDNYRRGSGDRQGYSRQNNGGTRGHKSQQGHYKSPDSSDMYGKHDGYPPLGQPGYYDYMHKSFYGGYEGDENKRYRGGRNQELSSRHQPTSNGGVTGRNQMQHGRGANAYANIGSNSNSQHVLTGPDEEGFENQQYERQASDTQSTKLSEHPNVRDAGPNNAGEIHGNGRPVPYEAFDLDPKLPRGRAPERDIRNQDYVGLMPTEKGQNPATPGRYEAKPEGKQSRTKASGPNQKERYGESQMSRFSSKESMKYREYVDPSSHYENPGTPRKRPNYKSRDGYPQEQSRTKSHFSRPPQPSPRNNAYPNSAEAGRYKGKQQYSSGYNRMRNQRPPESVKPEPNVGLKHSEVPRSSPYPPSPQTHSQENERPAQSRSSNTGPENEGLVTSNPMPRPYNGFGPTSGTNIGNINERYENKEIETNVEQPLPPVPTVETLSKEERWEDRREDKSDKGHRESNPESPTVPTEDVPPTVKHSPTINDAQGRNKMTTKSPTLYRMVRRKLESDNIESTTRTVIQEQLQKRKDPVTMYTGDEIADTEQVEPSFRFAKTAPRAKTRGTENKGHRKDSDDKVIAKDETFSSAYEELRYPSWKAVSA